MLDYYGNGTFDVKYVLDNQVENNARVARVTSLNPLVTLAHLTSNNQLQRPSLMSPLHQPVLEQSNVTISLPSSGPTDVAQVVRSRFSCSQHDVDDNPLLKHLKEGRNKPNRWWRQLETTQRGIELVRKNGARLSQLKEEKNLVLVELVQVIKRLQLIYPVWPNSY